MDLELMLAKVAAEGFEIVEEDIHADVMIVNTCAFIKSAKEESIEAILDLGWLKENRDLKGIVVTGCLAQRYFDDIQKSIPEVDAVLGLEADLELLLPEFFFTSETARSARLGFFFSAIGTSFKP